MIYLCIVYSAYAASNGALFLNISFSLALFGAAAVPLFVVSSTSTYASL